MPHTITSSVKGVPMPNQIITTILGGEGNILSLIGIVLSITAIFLAINAARKDRARSNSWETYHSFQSEEVKNGRDAARKVLRTTGGKGFESKADFDAYFSQTGNAADRQKFHDLAAFYHQIGVLLKERKLDKEFTLLFIGPGLRDRWNVFQAVGTFYPNDFAYGGIYILYQSYLDFIASRKYRKNLLGRFQGARDR